MFATIEGPSYDALVADLNDSDSREKAYSLQYLGMNLGLVLAPTLGRLLDSRGYSAAWLAVGLAGIGLIILAYLLSETDKKAFPLLYAEK